MNEDNPAIPPLSDFDPMQAHEQWLQEELIKVQRKHVPYAHCREIEQQSFAIAYARAIQHIHGNVKP